MGELRTVKSQLDAITLGVKEALATCRSTLEQAIEDIEKAPVAESDDHLIQLK
jgi:hypothetical protein